MTTSQSVVLSGDERTTTALCERPLALEKDVLRRRIYAPLAYAPVRNAAVVPAVHSECLSLASWFPLVWRRQGSALEFVAIRALLNDQRAQPPAARTLLPMILHGYPFVFDPDLPTGLQSRKMLDDVFADAPTDVGATITTVNHRLSRATMSRFQTLDRFAHDMTVTAAVTEALGALNAFEPWALKFNIDGHTVEIPDLLVIRPALFDGGTLAPLLQQLGIPCAQMLSLHRISLFRAGILLVMAKAFLKATRDQAPVPGRTADMEPPPAPNVHLQPASA
ncbi:SapC family protein [Bradyrhizobium prioriisuperbiae]|uniref:SapC family protein n=1 Tax=Bradyrhizobium prioriisuperbiae TaxID=2854389 RepID=UPI0028EE8CB8|nr:SapC family protein [Bradyrhizobium prioritasuperba]